MNDELTITVGELRERLADHDPDKVVVIGVANDMGGVIATGMESMSDAIRLTSEETLVVRS